MTSVKMHVSYLSKAFGPADALVAPARRKLANVEFDTLIGTGLSGALVTPVIARALGKDWAIVRKDYRSHSDRRVEGYIGDRWVFVDDLIASGRTLGRVLARVDEQLREHCPSHRTEFVGAYLYGEFGGDESFENVEELRKHPSAMLGARLAGVCNYAPQAA